MDRTLLFDACPDPLAVVGGDVIREQNASWTEAMGAASSLEACFAPEDRAAVQGAMAEAAAGPASFVARLAAGRNRGASVRCTVWTSGGEARCVRLEGPAPGDTAADIARSKEKALCWMFERMDAVLWAITREGRICLSEGLGLERSGLRPGQSVGLDAFQIHKENSDGARMTERVLAGESLRRAHTEDAQTWAMESHPLRDERGEVVAQVGFSLAVSDAGGQMRQAQLLLQSVNELSLIVWAMAADGTCTLSAGKGLSKIGLAPGELVGRNLFAYYEGAPEIVANFRRALAGESFTIEKDYDGIIWRQSFHASTDALGKVTGLFAVAEDVTERARDEQRMREQLALIQAQKDAIDELVSPVLEVWRGVLVVPLIGAVGAERAAIVTERLLGDVVQHAALFAILDLTGIDMVDTHTAQHLFNIMRAVDLLGCTPLISGIRPSVAATMVSLGMDIPPNRTYSTLAEALRRCMRSAEVRRG